jgi:hypothetical protein
MLADTTGVSVLFSSGDTGDNFADFGLAAPNYPPSQPVRDRSRRHLAGGQQRHARAAEYGWSTGKQMLCTSNTTTNCGSATTSLTAHSATRQAAVVGRATTTRSRTTRRRWCPSALALRNEKRCSDRCRCASSRTSRWTPMRQTGMLIGLTQTFPNGDVLRQFKEGGTSLASPLLAGVIADADQAAGGSLGSSTRRCTRSTAAILRRSMTSFRRPTPTAAAVVRVNFANTVNASAEWATTSASVSSTTRCPETYCDGTGNCATRDVTLTTASGVRRHDRPRVRLGHSSSAAWRRADARSDRLTKGRRETGAPFSCDRLRVR